MPVINKPATYRLILKIFAIFSNDMFKTVVAVYIRANLNINLLFLFLNTKYPVVLKLNNIANSVETITASA